MPTVTKTPPRARSSASASKAAQPRRPTTATPPPRRQPARPPQARPAPPRGWLTAPQTRPRPPVRTHAPAPTRHATRPEQRHPSGAARPGARRRLGVVVVCGAVLALTIVGFHAVLAQNQVRLDRIREDIAAAETRYDQARLENSQLSSPERITEEAGRQGLVIPEVAPVAVPISGAVPKRGSSSDVIENYQRVKSHLDASP